MTYNVQGELYESRYITQTEEKIITAIRENKSVLINITPVDGKAQTDVTFFEIGTSEEAIQLVNLFGPVVSIKDYSHEGFIAFSNYSIEKEIETDFQVSAFVDTEKSLTAAKQISE